LVYKQFEHKGEGLYACNKRLQEHMLFLN